MELQILQRSDTYSSVLGQEGIAVQTLDLFDMRHLG